MLKRFPVVLASVHAAIVLLTLAWTFLTLNGDVWVGGVILLRLDYPFSLLLIPLCEWLTGFLPNSVNWWYAIVFLLLGSGWYYFIGLAVSRMLMRQR